MNEQTMAYTLPPADPELETLLTSRIEPADSPGDFPPYTIVDAIVGKPNDTHLRLSIQDATILVALEDARDARGALPAESQTIPVLLETQNDDGQWTGSIDKARQLARYDALQRRAQSTEPAEATLLVALRNGLSADVDGFRAFLPYKKSGLRRDQAFGHLGKRLPVEITGIHKDSGDLQLSREQFAEKEQAERFAQATGDLQIMDVVEGTVTSIMKFGAFVDIGGVEGLLHISEMSTEHIPRGQMPVQVGDSVRVQVVSIDEQRRRLGLSRKELQLAEQRDKIAALSPNSLVEGRVEGVTKFGAFIQLSDGLRGLCHISELSWTERIQSPEDVLKPGETHTFRIIDTDPAAARISLSLRQAQDNPWSRFVDENPPGIQLQGQITRVVERGLVIDLGEGMEGFVHLRELSWTIRAESPSDVADFQVGQTLTLVLLDVEPSRQNIRLGLKQLQPDPWDQAGDATTVGHIYTARVSRITEHAAFFSLAPGLDARMHISEMSTERVESIRSILRVDQEVEIMTINVDRRRRRIDVSIKAIEEKRLREQPHTYEEGGEIATLADAMKESGIVVATDKPTATPTQKLEEPADATGDIAKETGKIDERADESPNTDDAP